MITTALFEKLHAENLVSEDSYEKIKSYPMVRLFTLHWEIKTLLYLGVLLLSSGLGILVYKNIDTIGHQVIIAMIGLISIASFYYCYKNKMPFSVGKIASPNTFFDYVLLLGCLTFLCLIAYLQYQYNVFGNRYGLATFIPMVVLFFSAYYFDHLGVLSMAITNFAAWLGLTVTPMKILESNNFDDGRIILTGIAIGGILLLAAWATKERKIKTHFEFTYSNFGNHILFISLLAALFHYNAFYLLWFAALAVFAFYNYKKSLKEESFYFILITILYSYIGLSYVFIRLLSYIKSDTGVMYIGFLYFIVSGLGLVVFLIRTNKQIKSS